ncbi:MAG: ferritin [Candidatus Amoebophilus sp. 36-38]|nr:MAG: ferritin [Candidatus Amoebophilus sp. 36-38]
MDEIKRPTASLKQGTEELLNQQIAMEDKASAIYLAMASWCDVMGYKESAAYLYEQAEEERGHMLKIFHYVHDAGGRAFQPDVTDIQQNFTSLREVFELVLKQEINVSHAIHQIVKHCWDNQDVATFNFMQWFVQEQIQEETTARRILELFEVIGEAGVGLYFIDKEIGTLKGK